MKILETSLTRVVQFLCGDYQDKQNIASATKTALQSMYLRPLIPMVVVSVVYFLQEIKVVLYVSTVNDAMSIAPTINGTTR